LKILVVYPCNPSYKGGRGRRVPVPDQPRKKMQDLIWKITHSKKDWGHGSSDRALAFKHKALSSNPNTTPPKNKLICNSRAIIK
jgi:hypothetical protein